MEGDDIGGEPLNGNGDDITPVTTKMKMKLVLAVAVLVMHLTYSATSSLGATNRSRCIVVPTSVVSAIQTGLTVRGGGKLVGARAVRSRDYSSVYFVSAKIRAPGMGTRTIGTWATNRLRVGGLIYAVDSFANEFSDWGDGRKIRAKLSMNDDGAKASRKCVP